MALGWPPADPARSPADMRILQSTPAGRWSVSTAGIRSP